MKYIYYEKDGHRNDFVFQYVLEKIHKEIAEGDIADLDGLLRVRNKLYRLKRKHEESGERFLDCEYEIVALNEIIEETRKDLKWNSNLNPIELSIAISAKQIKVLIENDKVK